VVTVTDYVLLIAFGSRYVVPVGFVYVVVVVIGVTLRLPPAFVVGLYAYVVTHVVVLVCVELVLGYVVTFTLLLLRCCLPTVDYVGYCC